MASRHISEGSIKNYPLFPFSLGSPAVKNGESSVPLFGPDGKTNAPALKGDTLWIQIELVDVLASAKLAPQFYAALDNQVSKGKTWGQPQIKPTINVALKSLDPLDGNTPHTLSTCNVQRMDGKTVHNLLFKIDSHSDLQALRTASSNDLFVDVTVECYCKIRKDVLTAEGAVISTAIATLMNDIRSKGGDQMVLLMAVGGNLDSKAALRSFLRRNVSVDIDRREGYTVPTEVINAVLDKVCSGAFSEVNLQAQKADRMIGVVVTNRLLVTTPVGQLSSALKSLRKMSETTDIDQLSTGEKHSLGGGASVMGIGANVSVTNEAQRAEAKERMKRDLDESASQFSASLPTVTTMDAHHINELANTDSGDITVKLSDFCVRWEPLTIGVSLKARERETRLTELEANRAALIADMITLAKKLHVCSQRTSQVSRDASALAANVNGRVEDALSAQMLIGRFSGFAEWQAHLSHFGLSHNLANMYNCYMQDTHDPGVPRQVFLDRTKAALDGTRAQAQRRDAVA